MPGPTPGRVLELALAAVAACLCFCVGGSAALQNGFALPQLGWNSWNHFGCGVTEDDVRATADAFVTTGMKAAGYSYVNVDDCWMAKNRTAEGRLTHDPERFPRGMKALAAYVHSKGLRFGLYSARCGNTCQGRPGSEDHEWADAQTFASWDVDYLKYIAARLCAGWLRRGLALAACRRPWRPTLLFPFPFPFSLPVALPPPGQWPWALVQSPRHGALTRGLVPPLRLLRFCSPGRYDNCGSCKYGYSNTPAKIMQVTRMGDALHRWGAEGTGRPIFYSTEMGGEQVRPA